VQSLRSGQYYAHPRNKFWQLVGRVIAVELVSLPYTARLEVLLAHRIALWDVVAVGHRRGSLDADLRIAERSDLGALVAKLPELRVIACNGALAAKHLPELESPVEKLALPSSSPANTRPAAAKQLEWNVLARYLAD